MQECGLGAVGEMQLAQNVRQPLRQQAQHVGSVAGCGSSRTYTYIWPDVTPGEYDIFAVVSPGAGIADVKSSNNQLQRKLFFATDLAYLPTIWR